MQYISQKKLNQQQKQVLATKYNFTCFSFERANKCMNIQYMLGIAGLLWTSCSSLERDLSDTHNTL
jgi:hypothetical protein